MKIDDLQINEENNTDKFILKTGPRWTGKPLYFRAWVRSDMDLPEKMMRSLYTKDKGWIFIKDDFWGLMALRLTNEPSKSLVFNFFIYPDFLKRLIDKGYFEKVPIQE